MVDGNAGKGSKYRPVDKKKWDKNWHKAFDKTKKPRHKRKHPGVMEPGGIVDVSNIIEEREDKDE